MPTRSSRQALAALGAPAVKNADAAFGHHPLAKPVATLADELARLISALHDTAPVPVANMAPADQWFAGGSPCLLRIGRAYTGSSAPSQRVPYPLNPRAALRKKGCAGGGEMANLP